MADTSQLIQPLICTQAMSTLTNVVPGVESGDRMDNESGIRSGAMDFSRHRQAILTSIPLVIADLIALSCCYLLAFVGTFWLIGMPSHLGGLWNNLAAVCLCHMMLGTFLGLFPASGMNPVRELRNQLTSISGSFLVLIALNGLVGEVSRNEILTIAMALPLSLFVAPLVRFSARKLFAPFRWWGERVIVVGSGQQGRLVYEFLERQPQRGLKPLGMVDDNPGEYWLSGEGAHFDFLGKTSELVAICRKRCCHWVIAAVADKTESQVRQILAQGSLIPNLVVLSTGVLVPTLWVDSFDAAGLSGVHIRDRLLCPLHRIAKRAMDAILAAAILALASPLVLFIAVWIKLASPGPVFFRHQGRIGRNGRPFGAFKIRTMAVNSEELLKQHLQANPAAREEWDRDLKLRNDPRIVPGIGHFLRRTSLDELPQLWNVLIGEMSLVGPRPIVAAEIAKYSEFYSLYHRVRPGLSGLWQISGRNNTSYEDRVRLDSYYVRNWSLWLDYFILLRTVRTVLLREGSY